MKRCAARMACDRANLGGAFTNKLDVWEEKTMPMQGGGGGKPEKPESENVWKFPWLIPQPPPEPIPDRPPAPIEPPSPPEPEPVTGPPAFDTGPSPYLTPEVTSYARPPSSKEEADRRKKRIERARKRWENAKQRARTAPPAPVIDEIPPDIDEPGLIDFEQLPASDSPDWPVNTPLTQGQEMHVDHLLSVETGSLAREVLIGLKREGMPSKAYVSDFVSQFAEWGWDDLSSALALQVLEIVRQSDWDALLEQADSEYVETVAQDLADNTIEGLTVMDARTGRVLLNRTGVLGADGQQYVGLQDYEVEAFKGLDLIFVHNHPNDTDASEADLRAAFAAGAEMLMVVTSKGYEYIYIRGRNGMVGVRAEDASYEVGPETAAEHVVLEARSWEQARADRLNPPELMMLQEEQYVELRVNGDLRMYEDEEAILRDNDEASIIWPLSSESFGFRVLDQHLSRPYVVKIEVGGNEFWIDLRDPDTELEFRRVDLASTPFLSQRAQVSEQKYDNTSLDFLNALTEALNPQPISVEHGDSSTGTPPEYGLQSIVADSEGVPVALSHGARDRSGAGLISQDYNKITDIYRPFQVQSPVVGPDVKVEFVVPAESNDTRLGNYVVISFPASVYLENEEIMQSLFNGSYPSQWTEDGRIFVAYGHLSEIHEDIYPGKTIGSQDEAIIGKTGNTGLTDPDNIDPETGEELPYENTEDYHDNQHLDLAIVYYGSNMPGEMAAALQTYRSDRDYVHFFFGYANRSTLDRNNDYRLYGENIDPDRIPGLFYVSTESSR